MINFETTSPFFGEMYSAALTHSRIDLMQQAVEMERSLDSYFIPDPQISLEQTVDSCVRAAELWSSITGNPWKEDRAAISKHLSQMWDLIFANSRAELLSQHSPIAP